MPSIGLLAQRALLPEQSPEANASSSRAATFIPGLSVGAGSFKEVEAPLGSVYFPALVPSSGSYNSDITGAECDADKAVSTDPLLVMIVLSSLVSVVFLCLMLCRGWLGPLLGPCARCLEGKGEEEEAAAPEEPATKAEPEPAGDVEAKKDDGDEEALSLSEVCGKIDYKIIIMFVVVTIVGWVQDLYFTMVAPFLPGVANVKGVSDTGSTIIFSAHPVGMVLSSFVIPYVLKQSDPFSLLRTFVALSAVCIGLEGLAEHYMTTSTAFVTYMILVRIWMGLLAALAETCVESTFICILEKKYITPIMSLQMGVRSTAVIIGPPIGSVLYEAGCWPFPFLIGTILLLFAALLLTCTRCFLPKRFIDYKPKEHVDTTDTRIRTLLTKPTVGYFVVPSVFSSGLYTVLEPQWQQYLGREPFNMTPTEVGTFLLVPGLTMIVAIPIAGLLPGILGNVRQWFLGFFMLFPCAFFVGPTSLALMMGVPQTIVPNIIGLSAAVFSMGLTSVTFYVVSIEIYEKAGYTKDQIAIFSIQMNLFLHGITGVLGPLLGAWFQSFWDFPTESTFITLAGFFIVGPCALMVLLRHGFDEQNNGKCGLRALNCVCGLSPCCLSLRGRGKGDGKGGAESAAQSSEEGKLA